MILLIDNYDSFTWNLVHLIGGLGKKVDVVRNDALTAAEAIARRPEAIVISPGPGAPADAGVCIDLVKAAIEARTPLFGVCLGMQAIAEATGGKVVRAGRQMHGKTSDVRHDGGALFEGLPSPFTATRYHSLVAEPLSLPSFMKISASSVDDGEAMALEHKAAPIAGVQFHPESVATSHGAALLRNFFSLSARP